MALYSRNWFVYFTVLKNDEQEVLRTMCPFSSLQTQMNLQLCFINNSESEDEEEQEVGKKELKNTQVKNRGSRKWFYWLSWTWFLYIGPSPCVSGHRCWWRKVPFRSSRTLNLLPKHRIPNSGAWRTLWRIYGLEWGQTTEPWWESNDATLFCQSGPPQSSPWLPPMDRSCVDAAEPEALTSAEH